jgi:lysyl-tRNA synthetase, class II
LAEHPLQDIIPDNDQTRARKEHLEALGQLVGNVYPNKFVRSQVVESGRDDTLTAIAGKYRALEPPAPEGGKPEPTDIEQANQQLNPITVRVAGRLAAPPRVMGKAAFVHLSDGAERLQIYVKKADVSAINNDTGESVPGDDKGWELFGLLDHGDFVGVEGFLFVTRTGELSVHVRTLQFLSKALLPLPDKMHGINDPEIRQRQRYADLIAGSLKLEREPDELTPREVFERRAAIVRELRRNLEAHGYLEVETPMLTPLATGAAARPFKTHHNALDIDLYARIAPELYLKRLLVGGFEKVYELNRNFRNEGVSTRHNPEFTMLEFYWAYADVNQMMDFCEELLRATVTAAVGQPKVKFGEHEFDFSQPFRRLTMKQAIVKYWPDEFHQLGEETFDETWLDDPSRTLKLVSFLLAWDNKKEAITRAFFFAPPASKNWEPDVDGQMEAVEKIDLAEIWLRVPETNHVFGTHGDRIAYLFERFAERQLDNPTFIFDFPKAISPLSKASPSDLTVAERFELYISEMEVANGFSELNDPAEQYERFNEQMKARERGDEEAMVMDEDYIRALSYGMPPAAGIGIGIDRFTMLLTNRQSIRDVILFPHLRPERKREETED